jgi:hypothetical protein
MYYDEEEGRWTEGDEPRSWENLYISVRRDENGRPKTVEVYSDNKHYGEIEFEVWFTYWLARKLDGDYVLAKSRLNLPDPDGESDYDQLFRKNLEERYEGYTNRESVERALRELVDFLIVLYRPSYGQSINVSGVDR